MFSSLVPNSKIPDKGSDWPVGHITTIEHRPVANICRPLQPGHEMPGLARSEFCIPVDREVDCCQMKGKKALLGRHYIH